MGVRVEVPLACCRSDAPVGNAGRASQGGISVETTLRSFCCCSFLCATGQAPGGVSVTTHGSTDLQRFVVHNVSKVSEVNSCFCPIEEEGLGGKVLRISDIKDIRYIKISKRDIKDIKDMRDIKDTKRI